MGKARIATGVLLVTLVTGAMGYTIASAVLTYQDLGFGAEIDFAYIAQNYMAILDRRPEDAQLIHLIIGSFAAVGLMLSLALSGSALTRFGQTHWQTVPGSSLASWGRRAPAPITFAPRSSPMR
jgi:type IV secretion system protein VirD4